MLFFDEAVMRPDLVEGPVAVLRRLCPYFLLTALGLLFFGDLVAHPTQVLYSDHSDFLAMHLPMKRFLARSWQETGALPLWCPYSFGGTPFIHDVQVAAFYPPHWILYLLPETAVGAALSWLVVGHVVLAGWCMFAYAGSRGLGHPAAFVSAVGYMFAGKWLLHILAGGHSIMTPLAWLPLVLLYLERALRRGSLGDATWAGGIFALIVLGTHPQMTLYAGLFIAVWSLGAVLIAPGPSRSGPEALAKPLFADASGSDRLGPSEPEALAKPLFADASGSDRLGPGALSNGSYRLRTKALGRWLHFGLWMALVAVALSAVQLFPALEAAPESSRGAGVGVREILAAAMPTCLGLVGPGWTPSWEDRAGLGVLWVAAACLAPVLGRGRVRFDGAVCLALLVFSLGGAALLQWLPGFRLFQIPGRMLMLLALPVALLAGTTTQALLGEAGLDPTWIDRCRRVGLRVVAAAVFLGLAFPLLSGGLRASPQAASASAYWAVVFIAAPVFLWLLRNRCQLSLPAWYGIWTTCLLADAWALTWPQVAVCSEAALYTPSASVQQLVAAEPAHPGNLWRVLDRGLPGEPSSTPLGAALPQLGPIALQPVLGYNSFDVRRYKEYLQFVVDEDQPIRPRQGIFGYPIVDAFPLRNKPLLDLLGVRYLLQPYDSKPLLDGGAEPLQGGGWRQVAVDAQPAAYSFLAGGVRDLPAYALYENPDYLPRAFVVYHAVPLAERPGVLRQLKATDFRREVLLEGAAATATDRPSASVEACPAVVREYLPNRVVLEAHAELAGYLVLTDMWFPGWTCTVDGQPTPLYRANYLFRAVAVPAGKHEVVFTFLPDSYCWGRLVSLLALAVFLPLGLLSGLGRSGFRGGRTRHSLAFEKGQPGVVSSGYQAG
jgi:hypothetical protein